MNCARKEDKATESGRRNELRYIIWTVAFVLVGLSVLQTDLRSSSEKVRTVRAMSKSVIPLLNAFGNRLNDPKKARVTYRGRIIWEEEGGRQEVRAALVWEHPGLLRIEKQVGSAVEVVGFDGQTAWRAGREPDEDDLALIQLALYDTPEYFFIRQATTTALFLSSSYENTRLDSLGNRHKAMARVYQLKAAGFPRARYYFFNVKTLLLDTIRYEVPGAPPAEMLEVQFQEWTEVEGELIAKRITKSFRKNSLSLIWDEISLGPSLNDDVFSRPQ
jgi:hypothetical protein